jgi:hypothetical protein
MAAKRYAVLDKTGKCINHIVIDDPMPKGYWPGYGATLCPLESADFRNGGAGLDVIDFKFGAAVPQIGDTVNLQTGAITKFVPQQTTDPKTGASLNSAPTVKMVSDVAPQPGGGTVVVKG